MNTQRGFTLLIGMLLLMGITVIGLSLIDRGLLDIRSAARFKHDITTLQAAERDLARVAGQASVPAGTTGQQAEVRAAVMALARMGECVPLTITERGVSTGDRRANCRSDHFISVQRIDNPCLDERLIRRNASSSGLVVCRYFDARLSRDDTDPHSGFRSIRTLHQGLQDVTVSAVSDRSLIIRGEGS